MSERLQKYWRSLYKSDKSRFIECDGKIYPIVSGGRSVPTTVSIAAGVADRTNLRASWELTFSNAGGGFTADDITQTPADATVTVSGTGNTRTVTLTVRNRTDVASFVLNSDAFTNRNISTDLAGRTSDTVEFVETTTVSIGTGFVDRLDRTISWVVSFSNGGDGLNITDITPTPSDAARLITGTGNAIRVTLRLPGTSARSGSASFVIDESPFTDRVFASTVTTSDRTAPSTTYNFQSVTETPLPTTTPAPDFLEISPPYLDDFQVILGDIDISENVQDISNITRSLDDGELYYFRIAEATLTVSNPEGEFSSHNPQNQFVLAGGTQAGFRSSIRILKGFDLIFTGEILEIRHDEESGEQRWIISDASVEINENDIENFGLEKRIQLSPFNRAESSSSGIYPFPTALSPPSEESASGVGNAASQDLIFNNFVNISGVENPLNVDIQDNELLTQGEYLSEGNNPIVAFKTPYRYSNVETLIKEVLEHYGLSAHNIVINPILDSENGFHSLGRVGYTTEATLRSTAGTLANKNEWQWTGYVTDFMLDSEGPRYIPLGIRSIAEFQGSLYGASHSNFYRIYPESRTFKDLGDISAQVTAGGLSRSGVVEGLTAFQDKLVLLTRRDLYYVHIDKDDNVSFKRLILIGQGINSGQLSTEEGWATGLTSRRDELFIGKRQGLFRAEISGINARLHRVINYNIGIHQGMESRATANSIEYLNGRFYFMGGADGGYITSFEMETGYTPTPGYTRYENTGIGSGILTKWKGNLLGLQSGKLVYLNNEEGRVDETLYNPTLYFLYSARQEDTRPRLISFQILNDTWNVEYEHNEHAEFWQMETDDFVTFHILGTEAEYESGVPIRGAYNTLYHTGATPNTNKIWELNTAAIPPNATVRVDATNVYRPQIAQYYHTGFQGRQNRYGFLPDTRKGIYKDLTNLYYIYATDDESGIARLDSSGDTTSMLSAPLDNWHNECGVGFHIHDGTIYAGFTFVSDTTSTLKIVARSLGRLPRFARINFDTTLTEGTAYDESVYASGNPAPTITSSVTDGTLPDGLTLDEERLHGTPTNIPSAGVDFTVTFTATNERGPITLPVEFRVKDENAAAPQLDDFTDIRLVEDTAYDETITATGTPTPVITSTSTSLPTGMTLAGARLHGTPTGIPNNGLTFTVFWTATNSEGTDQETIVFTVSDVNAPIFGSFTSTSLTEGTAYDETLTVRGNPTPTLTSAVTTGTLPTGLTLADGRLHGTPSAIPDAGTNFTVTFTGTNSVTTSTLVVEFRVKDENAAAPVLGSFTETTVNEGQAYDSSITATGSPTPVITSTVTTGTLPTGMTLVGARLHGTPTGVPDAGSSFTVTFSAANSEGTDIEVVNFTVTAANRIPVLSIFDDTLLFEDVAYDRSATANGLPVPTITSSVTSGTLPTGLTLDDERLHGTPTNIPDSDSRFTITFTATNSEGTDTEVVNFQVVANNRAPVFNAFSATTLTEDQAYDQTITAGGRPAVTITSAVTTGTLPTGLTLADARLHGTPTGIPAEGSTFTVTFTATNLVGTATNAVAFTVNSA